MKKFLGLLIISAIVLHPAVVFAEDQKVPAVPALADEAADDMLLKADDAADELEYGDDLDLGLEDEGENLPGIDDMEAKK